jgi:hypothetical protein
MTDLRQAAEMALEALEEINKLSVGEEAICLPAEIDGVMEALRQALAHHVDNVDMSEERVHKTDKSIHEPVAWMKPSGLVSPYKHGSYQIPLYAAPPKKEWVGYTNEDRERIVPMLVQSLINHDKKTMAVLLNAILIDIDQQLKEKNT